MYLFLLVWLFHLWILILPFESHQKSLSSPKFTKIHDTEQPGTKPYKDQSVDEQRDAGWREDDHKDDGDPEHRATKMEQS